MGKLRSVAWRTAQRDLFEPPAEFKLIIMRGGDGSPRESVPEAVIAPDDQVHITWNGANAYVMWVNLQRVINASPLKIRAIIIYIISEEVLDPRL